MPTPVFTVGQAINLLPPVARCLSVSDNHQTDDALSLKARHCMSHDTQPRSTISPHDHFSQARDAVLVFGLNDRTQIELKGEDRAKFLHGFCTNDIKRLTPGQGCEGFLTNIKGKVVGHVFVFATATSLWLDTVAGQGKAIISHLDRYLIREDVQFVDHSADRGALFVTGPDAAQLLMLDEGLPPCGHVARESFGQPFDIRRIDLFGPLEFLISVPRSGVETVKRSLLAVGCVGGTSELFESLRIAAGFPQYGIDITDENLAQEVARTAQCISFTKGCYLGQEPIARLDAMGHTNRELRRLRFDTGAKPTPGIRILAVDTDDDAGLITSVSPLSTATGQTIALGYLKTRYSKPDTPVRVLLGNDSRVGTVF